MLQVWYSAGWTDDALHGFHASVAALLQQSEGLMHGQSNEVRKWLQAWDGATVPLTTARELWYHGAMKAHTFIGDMLRKDDRMAACTYVVSGDVPLTQKKADQNRNKEAGGTSTGSVVMFKDCENSCLKYEFALNENFLKTFPPEVLLEERLNSSNFYVAGAVLARSRVDALKAALQSKALDIEVRLFCFLSVPGR